MSNQEQWLHRCGLCSPTAELVPNPIKRWACLLNNCSMPISQPRKENLNTYIFYTKANATNLKERVHTIKSLLRGSESLCEWRFNNTNSEHFQIRKHGFRFHFLQLFNFEQMSPWVSVSSSVEWDRITTALFTSLLVVIT